MSAKGNCHLSSALRWLRGLEQSSVWALLFQWLLSSLTLCSKEQGRAGSPHLAQKLGLVLQASCPAGGMSKALRGAALASRIPAEDLLWGSLQRGPKGAGNPCLWRGSFVWERRVLWRKMWGWEIKGLCGLWNVMEV